MAQPPGPKFKILVVERHQRQGHQIEDVCQSMGVEVLRVANGREALALVSDPTLAGCFVDILVENPDGFTLCAQLKAHKPSLYVTVMSDLLHDRSFVHEDMRKAKADAFLGRSFEPARLSEIIKSMIEPAKTTPRFSGMMSWRPVASHFLSTRLADEGRLEHIDLSALLFRIFVRSLAGTLIVKHQEETRTFRFSLGLPVAITEQDRELILDAFWWRHGSWRFSMSRAHNTGAGHYFKQNPFTLVRDAILRKSSTQELDRLYQQLSSCYVARTGMFGRFEPFMSSTNEEIELMGMMDGTFSIKEIVEESALSQREALVLLWSMHQARMIVFPATIKEGMPTTTLKPRNTPRPHNIELVQEVDLLESSPDLSSLLGGEENARSLWSRMFDK